MAIEYVNRPGDAYYLHEAKTNIGNPKYYFSMKKEGDLVNSIPEGCEIYENPNAQVFLRKITPKVIRFLLPLQSHEVAPRPVKKAIGDLSDKEKVCKVCGKKKGLLLSHLEVSLFWS